MSRLKDKVDHRLRRQIKVRTKVQGTSVRPRLSVTVSNRHVSAQIIDDIEKKTLVGISSSNIKAKGTLTEVAAITGAELGKKAKANKIKQVSFDRGGKLYHGRVKALADAARKEGLEF